MYKAPLKEIRFVMHQLVRDQQLERLDGFTDYSADLADSVLEEAGRFAEEVLSPINRIGDTKAAKWTPDGVKMPQEFKDAYTKFVEGGWPLLRAHAERGGQGAPTILGTAVEELWASSNLAFKLCPMLSQGAVEAIERCASEGQKNLYLPKMVTGEWTGTMVLTEPQAGSDLGAIRTRAVPDGDRYRIHGQKIFITYGDHDYTPNTIHMVLARIEGSPAGTKGISLFIVPKVLVNADGSLGERNDLRCVSIEHKLGIHASPTCVMSFGEGKGAIGYLVGEPNRGLEYMFIMMNAARLSVGLEGYALAERAYQQALAYARTRLQGRPGGKVGADGKPLPIAYHPDVKRMLLTMKAYADAARAITFYAALQLDLGHHADHEAQRKAAQARGDLLIPIVKAWSTEIGVAMTSLGVQVHGGMGFIEETGAAQFLRDVRITTIYEGTTGIQAADLVGRKVARDGGVAMNDLIEEMATELESASAQNPFAKETLGATKLLREATTALLRFSAQEAERALAASVPYLTLCGVTVGGWLMARSYGIAAQEMASDPPFLRGKQQIARAYMEQILPQAQSLAKTVISGSGSVVDADPELF